MSITALTALAPRSAHAATMPMSENAVPSGVLSLSAQASNEVAQDVVDITLFYEQEASDAGSLTDALNKRTAAALAQAKGVAGVSARTGTFSISPSTDRNGHISAWRGRTEVVLESRDFAAASKLAGQLNTTMQVGNVAFSLSPEAQRATADKLTGDAIASFRKAAESATRAFGYGGYTIREVNIGSEMPSPRPMFAMRAMAAPEAAPLPIEAGKARVTVNVSGSVQMSR
ncbi:SIMPL domain-containing protein [Trinickia sp. LjRoot230]